MSGPELLQKYINSRDLARGSVALLTLVVARYARHLGGVLDVEDFQAEKVSAWLTAMLNDGQLSRTTVKGYRRVLLTVWRWGYDRGHCRHPPLGVKPVKAPAPIPKAWTAADVNRLLDCAAKLGGSYRCGVPRALWFCALIRAAWDTGLRPVDLMSLAATDYNEHGEGAILQRKTGEPVCFRMRPSTLAAIEAIRPYSRPLVFGGVVSRTKFYRALRRLTIKAGLLGGLKKIRKGGASAVERDNPGRGHRYLGHRGTGMAERHYFDMRIIARDVPLPPELG